MHKNRFKTITNPFECPDIERYKIWKSTRNELIASFESSLLELSEEELTTVFNEWSGSLNLRLQSVTKKAQMSCLLTISILLHFRKTVEELNFYFRHIQNMLANDNTEVCRAAGKTLHWLAEEYEDNQSFLQETLETANQWLHSTKSNQKLFNAFEVLYEVGRFHPDDVLNIFIRHVDVIIPSVTSSNAELSKVATKTIVMHIRSISPDIGLSFAATIYFDCVGELYKGKSPSTRNFIMILRTIYDVFPSVVVISDAITFIVNGILHSDINVLKDSVSFLTELYKNSKQYFTKDIGDQIIAALQTQLLKHTTDTYVFPLVIDVITTLSPEIIPLDILVVTLISIINKESLKFQHEMAYDVLCKIVVLFPNTIIQTSSLSIGEPSVGFIRLMCIYGVETKNLAPFFIDWFNRGLKPEAPKNMIIIMLSVVYYFRKILPFSEDEIFEELERFMFCDDKDIRCKTADAFSVLECNNAIESLIKIAFYDQSLKVRRHALSLLDMSHLCSHVELLPQMLADPSIQLRNSFIDMISDVNTSYPYFSVLPLVRAINKLIALIIVPQSPRVCAKKCSSLPIIAKGLCPIVLTIIPGLLWCCVKMMRGEKGIPEFVPEFNPKFMSEGDNLKAIDLNKAAHYDPTTTMSTDLWDPGHVKSTDINLTNVLSVVRKRWDEVRDIHLLNTIGNLAHYVPPFIYQVIPVFVDIFSTKRTHKLYMTAVQNLSRVIDEYQVHGSFSCIFPNVVPVLIKMMCREMDRDLSKAVLRLIGTIGIISERGKVKQNSQFFPKKQFIVKSNSFYMKCLIDNIIELFDKPTPALLTAVVSIVARDTKSSLRIIDKVLNLIASSFMVFDNQIDVFKQLDAICYYCGIYIAPHLDIIKPILLKSMKTVECVSVCITLSIKLKSDFIEVARELYPIALKNVQEKERFLFKSTMKFITSMIINQGMIIDSFLEAIEKRVYFSASKNEAKYIPIIYKTFSTLVQYSGASIYIVRMMQIIFSMKPQITKDLEEVLINLCLFGEANVEMVLHYISFDKRIVSSLTKVEDMLKQKKWTIKDTDIVKERELKLNEEKFAKQIPQLSPPTKNVLMKVKNPVCNNSMKWIDDVALMVIQNSPNETIRSCSNVICQSKSIIHRLFPIVFIIYWDTATKREKDYFSRVVQKMLRSSRIDDPTIFNLIQAMECVGDPIKIDYVTLSTATNSLPLSRYYLLCAKEKNPNNQEIIEKLISVDVKMGFNEIANQIQFSDPLIQAKMYETLGIWDKALEIYQKEVPDKKGYQIICHSMLEEWDTVIDNVDYFDEISENSKRIIALYYAKAFFGKGEYKKAMDYMKYVNAYKTSDIFWKAKFFVVTKRFNEARQNIDRCFSMLAQNPYTFSGMTQSLAVKLLQTSHFLVELEEVINMKNSNMKNRLAVWNNRLINIKESFDTWMELLDIRSIALSDSYTVDICVKLLKTLRLENKWYLLPKVQKRISKLQANPKIIISCLKNTMAQKGTKEVFGTINDLLKIYQIEDSTEGADFICKTLSKYSINKCSSKSFNALKNDVKFKSDLLSMKGKIISYEEGTESNLRSIVECCKQSFELNNNVNAAIEMYVAYSKIIDMTGQKELIRDMFDSIFYVLRSTEKIDNAFLYLYYYIHDFAFDYIQPDEIIERINDLPYKSRRGVCFLMFETFTISPKDNFDFMNKVLIPFSLQHFDEVIYFMSYIYTTNNKFFKDMTRIILKPEEGKMFNDTLYFVDSLRKCSVTLCEKWILNMKNEWIPNVMSNTQEVLSCIRSEIMAFKQAKSKFDEVFASSVEDELKVFVSELNRYVSEGSSKPFIVLEALKTFLKCFTEKLKSIETIQFSSIIPGFDKRDLSSVPIPVKRLEGVEKRPTIYKVSSVIKNMPIECGMRLINITCSDGVKREFLLQANDTRIDDSLQKIIYLIQSRKNVFDVSRLPFKNIVLISNNLGIILWPSGSQTLYRIVSNYRKEKLINQNVEEKFVWQHTSMNYDALSSIQRLEVYDASKKVFNAHELRETFWYKSIMPQLWLESTRAFTISYAHQSLMHFIVGVGERNAANFALDIQTGSIMSFNYKIKKNYDKLVPFRLTRMIENALDGFSSSGIFRTTLITTEKHVSNNRKHILDILEMSSIYFKNIVGEETSNSFIKRSMDVINKISSNKDIPGHVDQLIKASKDPSNFTRFPFSWEPFW